MSSIRLKLIKMAFDKLDRFRDEKITVDDLKSFYNVKKNPKYLNGEWSEEQCLKSFLDSFEIEFHKNNMISYDDFINYYAGVSASIEHDCYFDVIL
jgi:hypothetical protein